MALQKTSFHWKTTQWRSVLFPQSCLSSFFTEEKLSSCISSSFFCHKSSKVFTYQHSPNGDSPDCPTKISFFYSCPDITLCPHKLLRCPEPLFFFMGPAKPVHKPFSAELPICITGDSAWQKAECLKHLSFDCQETPQELKNRRNRNTTFGISEFFLSKWSVVILFNFYFGIVYSLKYFLQWLSTSNQYQNHWNFSFYEERIKSWHPFSFGVVCMIPAVQTFS